MDKIDLKNFIYLTIAGIVNAFGVTIFLAPVKLYDSGISGTSMLLSQMTPPYMSLSFFLILLNIPLFMFGLKKQGREFTVYAVYAVMVYSIAAWYITEVSPIDVSVVSPLAGSDLLLCALFGPQVWWSYGWHRSNGCYIFQEVRSYGRYFCYGIQCDTLCSMWSYTE